MFLSVPNQDLVIKQSVGLKNKEMKKFYSIQAPKSMFRDLNATF